MRPLVIVPHTETGLRTETFRALLHQCEWTHFVLTRKRDPFSYIDLCRRLWRLPGELILCEQDVVPPRDAIRQLVTCQMPWCTHPHWTGNDYDTETFGLVHFSHELRQTWPDLYDQVVTRDEPRLWVRRGWTAIDRRCSVATLNDSGRVVCLLPGAPPYVTSNEPYLRPTSHRTWGVDTDLAAALHRLGVEPHVHPTPTRHLHDYDAHPAGSVRDWTESAFHEHDWEQFDDRVQWHLRTIY